MNIQKDVWAFKTFKIQDHDHGRGGLQMQSGLQNLTDKEYESLVLDFANSINLSFHFDEDAELLNYYLLNITGSDKKQIRALVEWMIESANETVSNNFNVRLTQTLNRLDTITQLDIEQLSSEIIETKNFHQAQIDDDILEIKHEIDEIKQIISLAYENL